VTPRVTLDDVIAGHSTVVCCGAGGVGKTTTAAVLAMHAARSGRSAVVVTIDPARRLAHALGLDELGNEPRRIDPRLWDPHGERSAGGELSAVMLDAKSTFDMLVRRYAAGPDQAERILANTFYRNISSALSGTQEYMAMEKLYELHENGEYDLVVVDTPPSRNALDFLDAPNRVTKFLEGRFFRILTAPARGGMKLIGGAARAVLKGVSKIIGGEVLQDIVDFFAAFEGMYDGFRDRALRVREVLASPDTAFLIVASPRRDALVEAEFFARELRVMGFGVSGAIVNRMHPRFTDSLAQATRLRAGTLADGTSDPATARHRLAALYANLADFQEVAQREENHLATLQRLVEPSPVARVPFLGDDVHDFATLSLLEQNLFDRSTASAADETAGEPAATTEELR
jgi:anion-transporting  ArsA/GET3 family ATPase